MHTYNIFLAVIRYLFPLNITRWCFYITVLSTGGAGAEEEKQLHILTTCF